MVFLVTIPIHDGSNESSERNNLGSETNSEIITKSLGHTLGNKRKYIKYRFKCKFCEKMAKIELKNMVKTRFGHYSLGTAIGKEGQFVRRVSLFSIASMTCQVFAIYTLYSHPNQEKIIRFVIFSVFSFGCLGRNHYLCSDFVTCWLSMVISVFATCVQHPVLTHW